MVVSLLKTLEITLSLHSYIGKSPKTTIGLPAIVRAGEEVLDVANGTLGILDGESGKLYLKLSETDAQAARKLQQQLQHRRDAVRATCFVPVIITDGYRDRVEVTANINCAAIGSHSLSQMQRLAQQALQCRTVEVRNL